MTTPIIDLRSDTVTRPIPAMRSAIAHAEVGDDVLGDDPTTRRLEERVAALLGHETALFFPSGTQANQVALGLLAPAGSEVIVDANAHLLHYEQGGAGALWGVQLRPVVTSTGMITPEIVGDALRSGEPDEPVTALIAVENTHNAAGGRVQPLDALRRIRALGDSAAVPVHIDGARLWNAATALAVEPSQIAALGNTVMVSFSKGLGCPVGSCLAFPRVLRDRAIRLRRRLGGGMRQSGLLAAAAEYALDNHLSRLGEDHRTAALLADALADCPGLRPHRPETNILMIDTDREAGELAKELRDAGVLVSVFGPTRLRAVTHMDVGEDLVTAAADAIRRALTGVAA